MIGTLAVAILIGGGLWRRHAAKAEPVYETVVAERGTLIQTVEVTGEVKPSSRVELSFKTGGKLETIPVRVGQLVKTNDLLATLDTQEATFALRRAGAVLAQARANLASRQAQDSQQAIQIAEASRDQAKANLEKAQADLLQIRITAPEQVRLASIALDTARANLANSGQGADLGVETSMNALRTSLNTSVAALSTALTETDALLGIENSGANDAFESVLGIYDKTSLMDAQGFFLLSRASERQAALLVRALSSGSSAYELLAAGRAMSDALQKTQTLLGRTQTVLTNSGTSSGMSTAELAAKRGTIQSQRSTIATHYASISASVQTLQTSENARITTRSQLENAVKTAEANFTIAQANARNQVKAAETTVEIQRATLVSAEATLSQRKTPARAVDLQVLRAQVQDAGIAYEQAAQRVQDTKLRAPIAGVIAEVLPARGEQVVQNQKVMALVVTENSTVEASIPEADIAKLAVDQKASITLEAFGDEVKFEAKLLLLNPDRIKIQDATFYKAVFVLEATDRPIKPGMTANLVITTNIIAGAVIVPLRAVRSEEGKRSVRVLVGKEAQSREVELGARGDDGKVQILRGVEAGELVITGETTK